MELRICLHQGSAGSRRGGVCLSRGLRRGEGRGLVAAGRRRRRGGRRRRQRGGLLRRDLCRRRPGPLDGVAGQGGAGGDVNLLLVGEGGHRGFAWRERERARERERVPLVNGEWERRSSFLFFRRKDCLALTIEGRQEKEKEKEASDSPASFDSSSSFSLRSLARSTVLSPWTRVLSPRKAAQQQNKAKSRTDACFSRRPRPDWAPPDASGGRPRGRLLGDQGPRLLPRGEEGGERER